MERYSRDTVVVTTAEINELAANKALDPTVEYWVDRSKFAYAPDRKTIKYLVDGDGNLAVAGPYIMGLLGDSRFYASHITDGGTSGTTYPAQEIATTRDDKSANGVAYHLEAISRGAILVPRSCNFAISGQRSWEISARAQVACSLMRAAGAQGVVVLCGTNDYGAAGYSASDSITAIGAIVAAARIAGLRCYLVAELPRGDSSFPAVRLAGTNLTWHMAVRNAITAMHDGTNVIVADAWELTGDATSASADALLGQTIDGLHPNGTMSQRIASTIWIAATSLIRPYSWSPASAADLWATNNPAGAIQLNPVVTGTGGALGAGMSGTQATSWTGGGVSAGITCVASSVTVAGRPAQQFVLGGTSSTTTAFDLMRRDTNIGTSGLAVGLRVRAVACLDIDAASTGLYDIDVYAASSPASARTGASAAAFAETTMADLAMVGAVMVSEVITIPTGATSVRIGVRAYPKTASVSATVRVRWIKLIYA